ncbi:hypothetical protein L4D09_22030 [Photobacterium makurazakiensis]|uniref:hypothetical protein n=1 Tax=Photobacterium makurazakiensis TaxID=2910234 RepID=UPI003D09CFB9
MDAILFYIIWAVFLLAIFFAVRLVYKAMKTLLFKFKNREEIAKSREVSIQYVNAKVLEVKKWHERKSVLHLELWISIEGIEHKIHFTDKDLLVRRGQDLKLCICNDEIIGIYNKATNTIEGVSSESLAFFIYPPRVYQIFLVAFASFIVYMFISYNIEGLLLTLVFSSPLIFLLPKFKVALIKNRMEKLWNKMNFN